MSINYKIKIVYDFDERVYRVFVDGMKDIEGFGNTEQEAVEDFNKRINYLTKGE